MSISAPPTCKRGEHDLAVIARSWGVTTDASDDRGEHADILGTKHVRTSAYFKHVG